MANKNEYLEQFKKRGITDTTNLDEVYKKGISTITGADQIAFKNAYEEYKSGLGGNITTQTSFTDKINSGNAADINKRNEELYSSGKINEKDYLNIRNKTRDIGFNELLPNPGTSPVTNSPGNIPPTDTPPTPPVKTAEDIRNSEDAVGALTDTIKENIDATQQQAQDFQETSQTRIEEDKKLADEQTKTAEDYAKKEQDLIKETDTKIAEIEKKLQSQYDERLNRDVEAMKNLRDVEVKKMESERELQKWKDEQAIKKAEKDLEVSRMKSNWAFGKMGATFSSYAINTSNKIASQGADIIAGLKVQANYNQADIQTKISKIEFDYSSDINKTIDKYVDLGITLEEQSIKRMYDVQNSLLKSEKEKNDDINKIKKEYLNNKRKTEDEMYAEMERLRDKQEEQTKTLEQELKAQENEIKTKINGLITTGARNSLSATQKNDYLRKANMTEAEVDSSFKSVIYSSAYNLIQETLGKDFLPSVAQMDLIQSEVDRLMLAGRPMEEAINIATNRVIKSTPEYARIQAINTKTARDKLSSSSSSSKANNKVNAGSILAFSEENNLGLSTAEANSLANLPIKDINSTLNSILEKKKIEKGIIGVPDNTPPVYGPQPYGSRIKYIPREQVLKEEKSNSEGGGEDDFLNDIYSKVN